MRHADVFPAVGSISGDCSFEHCFGGELLACLRGLVAHDGDPARFLASFLEEPDLSGDGHAVIMVLAMAACYSPNPASPLGFDLPMDLRTGERIASVWERWLEFDPVTLAPRYADALQRLECLHIECGLQDEAHLQWGARILVRRLRELGVECDHEEHPGGHRRIDHRWPPLLAKLARALA